MLLSLLSFFLIRQAAKMELLSKTPLIYYLDEIAIVYQMK